MNTAQEYLSRLGAIMGQVAKDGEISYTITSHFETAEEARLLINEYILKQKELSLLKKEINSTIQGTSKSFISHRERVGKSPISCLMRGLFGRGTVGKYNVLTRNSITMQKDKTLRPYREVVNGIDQIILAFEKQKIGIEKWLRLNK